MESSSEQTRRSTPTQIDVDDFKSKNNYLHTGNTSLQPASYVSHTDNSMTPDRMRGPWAHSVDMAVEHQNTNENSDESDGVQNHSTTVHPLMRLNPQQKGQQMLQLLQRAKRENWNDIFMFCEQLETIPSSLFQIQSLMLVDLRGNFLETVPSDIQRLVMLEELYLDSNRIKEIPVQLVNIPALRVLSFSRNQLTQIPKELSMLNNLTKLDVSYNQITEIPSELSALANRSPEQQRFVMIVEHNPLITLDPSLYSVIANVVTSPTNSQIKIPVSVPFPVQVGNSRLFIGDYQSENNIAALQYRKITHVVIAASELTPHYEQQFVYNQLNIPIVDESKTILSFLKNEALFQFIKEASHDVNKGILVCCQNGATRSVAIVIGFMMKLTNMSATKATQTLQQYYPLIHLTPEVIQQLQEYQQHLELQAANSLAESLATSL